MYEFSIPMALVDYIPVLFFGISAVILMRDLFASMGKAAFALFAAGTINIFTAGFLKATWKLLYAASVCDFAALNTLFLPMQSLGFLFAGLGIAGLFCHSKKRSTALAVAPPLFSGSFVFISMMVLGLGTICTCLSILAVKLKKKALIPVFAAAFVCYLGMVYMSSQDSTSALINWIEQGINCLGQGLLLCGVAVLHKAGLSKAEL